MRHSFLAFLIIFTFGTAPLAAQTVSPEVLSYPDMILHNGKVVTMDDKSNSTRSGDSR